MSGEAAERSATPQWRIDHDNAPAPIREAADRIRGWLVTETGRYTAGTIELDDVLRREIAKAVNESAPDRAVSTLLEIGDAAEMPDFMASFENWWARDGRFIDPDTDDVPWFDKRKELCAAAFKAALATSRNYVADDAVSPSSVTFANGRLVRALIGASPTTEK